MRSFQEAPLLDPLAPLVAKHIRHPAAPEIAVVDLADCERTIVLDRDGGGAAGGVGGRLGAVAPRAWKPGRQRPLDAVEPIDMGNIVLITCSDDQVVTAEVDQLARWGTARRKLNRNV